MISKKPTVHTANVFMPGSSGPVLQELMNESSLRQQLADVSHERDLLRAAAPQPPALGGELESKLIKLAAELANRRPLRPLQDICERQKSISTAKLIEAVEMCGDTLAAIALDIRKCVDASRARLAPLQAEIESWKACYEEASDKHSAAYTESNALADQVADLKAELAWQETDNKMQAAEIDQIKARCDELEHRASDVVEGFDGEQLPGAMTMRIRKLKAALSKPTGSEKV